MNNLFSKSKSFIKETGEKSKKIINNVLEQGIEELEDKVNNIESKYMFLEKEAVSTIIKKIDLNILTNEELTDLKNRILEIEKKRSEIVNK